jgi:membrane associated rhomboid family serine protease
MLLLPYQTRFSLASLPVVSLILIALNVTVFFGLQQGDEAIYRSALLEYHRSVLPTIEGPRYEAWLRSRHDDDARARLRAIERERVARGVAELGGPEPSLVSRLSTSDVRFRQQLRAGHIVTAGDPDFIRWREERDRYEAARSRAVTERLALSNLTQPTQWVTHLFLHADLGHLLGNMLVLLLAGPFVEAILGRLRFLAGYLLGGAVAGTAHLALSGTPLIGASGAIAASMGMVAVLYRMHEVPVFYWIGVMFGVARLPALALLPVWLLNELYQWSTDRHGVVAYGAHVVGLAAGALFAWVARPAGGTELDDAIERDLPGDRQQRQFSLLNDARAAAAKMDLRRATRLYRELIEQDPKRPEVLLAYFNVSMLGADGPALSDACLRLLWLRGRSGAEDMRRAFLQMAQPKVLNVLPVDEQLRLARRLVRVREDSAALRVLDRLLDDDQQLALYGRQLADALLGLYTTYNRNGQKNQADDVRRRLTRYFRTPTSIGGLAPQKAPPVTIRHVRPLADATTLTVPVDR